MPLTCTHLTADFRRVTMLCCAFKCAAAPADGRGRVFPDACLLITFVNPAAPPRLRTVECAAVCVSLVSGFAAASLRRHRDRKEV